MNDTEMILLQACENGRGAVLLSVARGKVSEGIDFGKTFSQLFESLHAGQHALNPFSTGGFFNPVR